jgi:hypothetical protein
MTTTNEVVLKCKGNLEQAIAALEWAIAPPQRESKPWKAETRHCAGK